MFLNTIKPGKGSRKKARRLGRGIGSGLGKTCGKGHKGQKARAGGYHKVGFEGGQMPLQRRLPKFGFTSLKALANAELRLDEITKVAGEVVDLLSLKEANIIGNKTLSAKVILAGKIEKALVIRGIKVSKGAEAAIIAAGGRIE